MKKKLLIIIPSVLAIILVAIAIVFFVIKRGGNGDNKAEEISVESWDMSDLFVLDTYEVENMYTQGYFVSTTGFYVEDKVAFEERLSSHESYIGTGYIYYIGAEDENGWFFCYNDALYGLMRFGDTYTLQGFRGRFSYDDSANNYGTYCYLSVVDYVPSNAYGAERNATFDERHSSYEDFAELYGHLSENVVKLDDEKQIIYLRMFDYDTRELVNDKCVCIDFGAKDVYVKEGIVW